MALAERDPERSAAALLVRRTTMRSDPSLIDQLVGQDRAIAVATIIDTPVDDSTAPVTDKSDNLLRWWFDRIGEGRNGLQDRMTFLWHSFIPTHRYSAGKQELIAIQLNTLRSKALGNFRDLLQSMMIDPAMLKYLNAESNRAKKPNENLAREIMELFTVGIGHYTEDDVRAAALALAGWRVDKDRFESRLDPDRTYDGEVTFLGETRRWESVDIVDRLCDHPATAERIASKVWYHFTGTTPSGEQRAELGTWWQAQNLEIKPLLSRIFQDEQFWASHYVRPRSGFEWYTATQRILNVDSGDIWRPRNLGQCPYEPPNVGGWPQGDRWLNIDSMLRRSDQLFSVDFKSVPMGMSATVDEVLDLCGLFVVDDSTVAALNSAAPNENIGENAIPELRLRIAMSCPEFQLQ